MIACILRIATDMLVSRGNAEMLISYVCCLGLEIREYP